MIQIIKGIIFGKSGKVSEEEIQPQNTPSLLATNPQQEPNRQREILRREAQIAKRSKH